MLRPLSIYIHWPFCKSKCPYCDFNSHVRDSVEHGRWRAALLKELAYYAALLPQREVVNIFFGGGTPSLMEAETVKALIDVVAKHWPVAGNIEITLEANPTSVEAAKLREFRAAGVNRVSLGVQALNAQDLTFLGRQHSAGEALEAVALAHEIFPRMSFDLIYARPTQTLKSWEAELTQAVKLTKGHMSLYQLTIEENTAFHAAQKRGELPTLDDDAAADMYALTASIMEAHNMPAYEISNYANPGQESLHNLTYWRGDDYIGVGPGAHGRALFGGHAAPAYAPRSLPCEVVVKNSSAYPRTFLSTENIKSPERWLEKVEAEGNGLNVQTQITDDERRRELIMMGLRLTSGIDYADWQFRTGLDVRAAINSDALQQLVQQGFLTGDDARMRVTPVGALILNTITGKLLA
jgi:oxygen-independent coproporphyrinogen-3 oxidase